MKAAIYARYSSDLQSDQSIDDQFRLCRAFADRQGYTVVAQYSDEAKSGASLFGRDGVIDLITDAASGKFEIVVTESLDRLSRDQEDLARLYKRMSFRGVKIMQVHGGQADEIQVGVRGLLGSLYLKDLADKTRRGLAGKVAGGQSAGGKAYGYRPVKGEPGRLEIVEEEAEVVRRIFAEYAGGASARKIATGLNRDGIPAPRGSVWNTSTIVGQARNLSGILRVPQYHGEIIWNKTTWMKDPDTGRRVQRINPPEEWQHIDVPELRIVDEKLWLEVQKRLGGTRMGGKGHVRKRRLLSGILKCGVCGGGMAVNGTSEGRVRIRCSRNRDTGSCTHSRTYFLDKVEEVVFAAFRELLGKPEIMKQAIDASMAERRKQIAGMAKERARAEAEVARAQARYDRAMDRALRADDDAESDRWAAQVPLLAKEVGAAREALAAIERPPVVDLHETAIEDYKYAIDNMAVLLQHGAEMSAAFREALRDILHAVVVYESEPHAPLRVDVQGKLFGLTGEELAKVSVAGAGFEPAAFRL